MYGEDRATKDLIIISWNTSMGSFDSSTDPIRSLLGCRHCLYSALGSELEVHLLDLSSQWSHEAVWIHRHIGRHSKFNAGKSLESIKEVTKEDPVHCALVCRAVGLQHQKNLCGSKLYCTRWGLLQLDHGKLRAYAWKELYIERDTVDMMELVQSRRVSGVLYTNAPQV